MALPKLRQLQYLVALADAKSFSKAADICNVTQSTLSAGIKDLENTLQQVLVDRSSRKVVLTAFGKELEGEARDMLQQAEGIVNRAKTLNDPFRGTLRLGVIPTIAPYALPSVLPLLQKSYPQLNIQIHEDLSARLVEKLENGYLDMILMAFPFDVNGLDYEVLAKESFVVASPRGQLKTSQKFKMDDLENHKVLLLEDGHCLRDHALEACNLSPRKNWQSFSATSLPTLIEMVRHGYGLTLLPEMAIKGGATPKDIDIIPFKTPLPTRQIGLAWRRGSTITAIQKDLSKTIKTGLLQLRPNQGKKRA